MSSFDTGAHFLGHVGVGDSGGAPRVSWIRPDAQLHRLPPPGRGVNDDAERTHVLIVSVLTLVCSALALYDLFLLAAGG
jgi:hypothetical protein